jgi:hypothetical protein
MLVKVDGAKVWVTFFGGLLKQSGIPLAMPNAKQLLFYVGYAEAFLSLSLLSRSLVGLLANLLLIGVMSGALALHIHLGDTPQGMAMPAGVLAALLTRFYLVLTKPRASADRHRKTE